MANENDVHAGLTPARYLAERVDDQLRWYGDRSASAKRWYQRLQLLTLVLAASVPVLSLASGDLRVRIAVALIGAATSVVAGVLALYRFGERWADYRSTAEALKHEKYRYLTGVEPYVGAGTFSLFVDRVESILVQENRAWRERRLAREDAERPAEREDSVAGAGPRADTGPETDIGPDTATGPHADVGSGASEKPEPLSRVPAEADA